MTDLDKLEELERKATVGNWGWLWCGNGLALSSEKRGRLYVCDAARSGMNGATIRFVERETPTNGGVFKSFVPPKERKHVSDWLTDEDQTPDMLLITALRNAAPEILAELRELRRIKKAFDGIIKSRLDVRLSIDVGLWKVSDGACASYDPDLLTAIEAALGDR